VIALVYTFMYGGPFQGILQEDDAFVGFLQWNEHTDWILPHSCCRHCGVTRSVFCVLSVLETQVLVRLYVLPVHTVAPLNDS
jgi:hypothetical protein